MVNLEERNRLVEQHMGLALALTKEAMGAKVDPHSHEFQDRLSDAYLYLVQAARTWNPSINPNFIVWATIRLRRGLVDQYHRGRGEKWYREHRQPGDISEQPWRVA